MKCPICKSGDKDEIFELNCGNFDGSFLYKNARIISCKECGHIYNKLNAVQYDGLYKYYNQEYSSNNLSSKSYGGDRPGSNDSFSLRRYKNLYKLLKKYIKINYRILDGGCATGGFMNFLSQSGFNNLFGIDFSRKYIDVAKKQGLKVKLGSVENIPYKSNSFDLVVIDQVLEHLINPSRTFSEAKKVLSPEGLLCISVPDAARYKKNRFFDFYWFLLREHIQHFDLSHLKLLGRLNGFELVDYSREESPMMSSKMVLPALNVLFRSQTKVVVPQKIPRDFSLKNKILSYVNQELKISNKHKIKLHRLALSKESVCAYGIGREFFYLYELALKKCNINKLIDDTPFKQEKLKVDGRKIYGSSVLKNSSTNENVLVTAFAHIPKLKANLKKLGYRGKFINL